MIRPVQFAVFGALLPLAACGGSSGTGTLTLRCMNGTTVVGVRQVAVTVQPSGTAPAPKATLAYPNPVDPGHTGSVGVEPGQKCTIAPTQKTS